MINTREPISSAVLAGLHTAWQQLIEPYSCTGGASSAWEKLQNAYGASARHYHNLWHIQALLEWATLFRAELQDYDAVCLAIWYHDVVYETRKKDNEERSAAFAVQELSRLNVPSTKLTLIEQMILATQQHQATNLNEDGRWFLDFDLSILGSQPETYQIYCQAIRREYRWVPRPLYRRGRRQVLESFLRRDQLFFTVPMRARLEAQARLNLSAELVQLA